MSILEALSLVLVMLPLAAMPSSSVALVVARSVSAGRVSGASSALGVVMGDLVFITIALIGMKAAAEWLGAFFAIVKYCGGAYLIWLGITLLKPKSVPTAHCTTGRASSLSADFLAGLCLTLGDVKAIVFYASLFPALVDMEAIGLLGLLVILAITAVTVGGVKLAYVILASRIVQRLRGRIASEVPRRLGGVLMIGCGSALIAKA